MDNQDNHAYSSIDDCRIVDLPRHRHPNGSLSVVENDKADFDVKRVYYIYDVPGDAERGGHSHRKMKSYIIAVGGSFDVTLSDGHDSRKFSLNRPYKALYVPGGMWRNLDNFSSGAVCLVLASELYSEDDYVRDYEVFKQLTAKKLTR